MDHLYGFIWQLTWNDMDILIDILMHTVYRYPHGHFRHGRNSSSKGSKGSKGK